MPRLRIEGQMPARVMLVQEYPSLDDEASGFAISGSAGQELNIYGFMDHPRYSSGYAAMHHTISFMPETHILKPYADRVWSTHALF